MVIEVHASYCWPFENHHYDYAVEEVRINPGFPTDRSDNFKIGC
jgi:hypothetical protein